ncbi:MAG: PH domain-containing protein [Planctomycetes bacterium]|nr:PH domain-containing protein [Planctomycetota bacterium]
MYTLLRDLVARLLRAPTEPPRVPDGAYREVEVLRASPKYLRYRLVGFSIGATFAVLGIGTAVVAATIAALTSGEPAAALALVPIGIVALVVAFFLFLAWFAVRIDYDLRYYVLTERSLRVREGAWRVAEMTLTFANVQNVRIEQGPLMRLFGIQDVVVETAGGGAAAHHGHGAASGHQVRLAGLENASLVRDRILEHVRRFGRSSGLGDPDDAGERDVGARGALGASPEFLLALREVRDGARAFRAAAEPRNG